MAVLTVRNVPDEMHRALGRELDLSDDDIDAFDALRDRTPAEPRGLQ